MAEVAVLRERVEAVFEETSRGLPRWPDPHPNRSTMPDEAYSRVTDAAKWRILAARTDAWIAALVRAGLATVETEANRSGDRRPDRLERTLRLLMAPLARSGDDPMTVRQRRGPTSHTRGLKRLVPPGLSR